MDKNPNSSRPPTVSSCPGHGCDPWWRSSFWEVGGKPCEGWGRGGGDSVVRGTIVGTTPQGPRPLPEGEGPGFRSPCWGFSSSWESSWPSEWRDEICL